MKITSGFVPGAPAQAPASWAKTEHDHMPLPNGKTVGATPTGELMQTLVDLQIPGVSHENGRAANVAAYAKHVENMREEAASKAVAAFLKGK